MMGVTLSYPRSPQIKPLRENRAQGIGSDAILSFKLPGYKSAVQFNALLEKSRNKS